MWHTTLFNLQETLTNRYNSKIITQNCCISFFSLNISIVNLKAVPALHEHVSTYPIAKAVLRRKTKITPKDILGPFIRGEIRRKLSRINGTLRRDLAKSRLIKEQVLRAVLK